MVSLCVCVCVFFFLMIRRPPRSTLFPYTNALPILHEEIPYLLGLVNQGNCPESGFLYLPQLLGDMMPQWETARKMNGN